MKYLGKIIIAVICCIVIFLIYKYRQTIFKPRDLQPLIKYGEKLLQKPKSLAIVISKYNENIRWLTSKFMITHLHNIRSLNHPIRINLYLYLKGNKPLDVTFKNKLYDYYNNIHIEKLKNVGMCDQTYLYHIAKNYDRLEDVTFFIPGSANNKIKINLLDSLMNNGYKYSYYFTYVRKEYFLPYYQSSGYIVTEKKNQTKENTNFEVSDVRPFGNWYTYYTKQELSTYDTNHKGIFSLSRQTIKKLPLYFYESMNNLLSKYVNSEDCHYMERMWYPLLTHF